LATANDVEISGSANKAVFGKQVVNSRCAGSEDCSRSISLNGDVVDFGP
jgi:hypothetical protein